MCLCVCLCFTYTQIHTHTTYTETTSTLEHLDTHIHTLMHILMNILLRVTQCLKKNYSQLQIYNKLVGPNVHFNANCYWIQPNVINLKKMLFINYFLDCNLSELTIINKRLFFKKLI